MSAPSYDVQTLAGFFGPLDPQLYSDPIVGPTLRHLSETDPDIIAAVSDVDRSLIRSCLKRAPLERLAVATGLSQSYTRFKRVSG
ncbi:MAG TPA: hypothetical protein VL137_04275 [Polyangiaceae bacterium]|jgi:hypothetical protein|nr:hypothetical protein [Polyangiaceae bacterium]